ncbi:PIG-L deacetylase family protein [Candidatus Latescibacterota bacterium]
MISTLAQTDSQNNQLRVLIIGAHPDDAEKCGGTAAKYIALGHKVQLVSLTNGDAGHQTLGGATLARMRMEEARRAGEVIGAEYIVLNNHDEELMPTLENRWKVIRLIREFKPDIVISSRPNDYHPDHRYTGVLVNDSAYLVTLPNVVADTPHLEKNPVFLYMSDGFTKPKFEPDIVVSIDDVIEKKIDMYHCHTSQMYEWLPYNRGNLNEVPKTDSERRAWLGKRFKAGSDGIANLYRDKLIELYGKEKGSKIRYAEAFEDSEYGSPLTKDNLKILFPFF